jgi:uncharacterized protein (TIGR01777 family)
MTMKFPTLGALMSERTVMTSANGKIVVVTGATGLIGGELVSRLADRGDHVIAFVRNLERGRYDLPKAAEHILWSDSMPDGPWTDAVARADAIVNLAGAPIATRWTEARKHAMYASRIDGTRHIVEAIARADTRPRVLVNGSAVGYYGIAPAGRLDESSPAGTDFPARICIDWECVASTAEASGCRVVLVRTGLVLDRREGVLAKLLLPFRFFVGGPLGSGRQPFPWIHLDDEIGIILWALDSDTVRGPVNATAPGIVSNREFSRELGKRLGRPSALPVPPFALRLLFRGGADPILGGQWAEPKRALELGYRFRHPDLPEALRSLDL